MKTLSVSLTEATYTPLLHDLVRYGELVYVVRARLFDPGEHTITLYMERVDDRRRIAGTNSEEKKEEQSAEQSAETGRVTP